MTDFDQEKTDSLDTPECFGEFTKTNRMCHTYCAVSIQCCLMHSIHPKVGLFEKLLIHNKYAPNPHKKKILPGFRICRGSNTALICFMMDCSLSPISQER